MNTEIFLRVFLLVGAVSTWIFLRPEWSPKVADAKAG